MLQLTQQLQQLANDNINLIYGFLHKYNYDIDEWYDVAAIGYCKGIATYDGNRPLSTYVYKCMYNAVCQELRKRKAVKFPSDVISLDAEYIQLKDDTMCLLDVLESNEETQNQVILNELITSYINSLNNEDKFIIKAYLCGYRQKYIMNALRCSQPKISRTITKFKNYIKVQYLKG